MSGERHSIFMHKFLNQSLPMKHKMWSIQILYPNDSGTDVNENLKIVICKKKAKNC
jgi:hypothetical protein